MNKTLFTGFSLALSAGLIPSSAHAFEFDFDSARNISIDASQFFSSENQTRAESSASTGGTGFAQSSVSSSSGPGFSSVSVSASAYVSGSGWASASGYGRAQSSGGSSSASASSSSSFSGSGGSASNTSSSSSGSSSQSTASSSSGAGFGLPSQFLTGQCTAGTGPFAESSASAGVGAICDGQLTVNETLSRTRTLEVSAETNYCFRASVSTFFGTGSVVFAGPQGTIVSVLGGGTGSASGTLPAGTYTIQVEADPASGSSFFAYELSAEDCP